MKDFELLKRTYPVSQFDRICDGYVYICDNTSVEERKEWRINLKDLQKTIKKGEKYIYQVAKDSGMFKAMCLSFNNYRIIRKHIFGIDDE